jgi:hypothetical protein
MEPQYSPFWIAFKQSAAWSGLMSMARYSPDVELRVLRLRVEILDAIAGIPNETDIQEAIWRLMELIASQSEPQLVGELVTLMSVHRLFPRFSLSPNSNP